MPDSSVLPEAVRPFGFLLGTWRGEGVGGYPTVESGDFRYGEEITFSCYGKPVIEFRSTSWALDDERQLARQSGFWRPTAATELEVVSCLATGIVEVLYGRLLEGPNGPRVELQSDVIAHTTTAKQVDSDKRMYAVRGDQLLYVMEMAAVGRPLQPHLSAALDRVASC